MGNKSKSTGELERVEDLYLGIHTLLASFANIQASIQKDRKIVENLSGKDIKLLNKLHKAIEEYKS